MSYNGSGTFNINTAGQPVVDGTVISSTVFNALTADLGTGLTTALTKDGQTTPTANIPLGTFKITGLGAGTAATDAVRMSQLQAGGTTFLTAAGTDTITATASPSLTAYATGNLFTFVVAVTNTSSVTLNIDGLGAKAVTRDGTTALAANDLVAAEVVVVVYDGTRFQVVNPNAATNYRVSGTLGVTGVATFTAAPVFSSATASLPMFTDGSKALVSNAMTGTGSVVMSASPTLTGTIGAANQTLSGTLGVVGVATLGNGAILNTPASMTATNISGTAASLTAGNVTTNANLTGPITSSGNATSIGAQTGTGSTFVMSASPTMSGTIGAASQTLSGSLTVGTTLGVTGNATFNTNTLFVDTSNDRVGIGTASPAAKLHVAGTVKIVSGGTSSVAILVPQGYISGDIGSANFSVGNYGDGSSEMRIGTRGFITFFTGASDNATGTERARIDSSGNVGIGTASPGYQLQLSTDAAAKTTTSTWTITSDERLKRAISLADTARCYEIVKSLPLKRFTWRDDVFTPEQASDRSKLGWIAQDVESVFPKAVSVAALEFASADEVTETVEEPVTETVTEEVTEETIVGNVLTMATRTVERRVPVMETMLLVDDQGHPVLDAEGARRSIERQKMHSVQKTRQQRHKLEDARSLNADQIYAALYGAVQLLIGKMEGIESEFEAYKTSHP